jgi:hypothetical protein
MTDTPALESLTTTTEDEMADISMGRPHVVLLGAGASRAALPDGDRNGVPVPLLRDVARDLELFALFAEDLRELAGSDFESAYSQLVERHNQAEVMATINRLVSEYFSRLELPDEPNLYDVLQLCLRRKDAIFTFNSFYDSWMANHPRRTGEAYWNQYMEAKYIEDNPVPQNFADLRTLVDWFRPLMDVE